MVQYTCNENYFDNDVSFDNEITKFLLKNEISFDNGISFDNEVSFSLMKGFLHIIGDFALPEVHYKYANLVADDGTVAEVAGVVRSSVVVQQQIPVHPETNGRNNRDAVIYVNKTETQGRNGDVGLLTMPVLHIHNTQQAPSL